MSRQNAIAVKGNFMKVELTWDQVEPLIRAAFRDDLKRLRHNKTDCIFSCDPEEEAQKRKEMIAAIRKVQAWYGK